MRWIQLTDELIAEGYMREVVRRIQTLRKTVGLQVTDRIDLTLYAADDQMFDALQHHAQSIASEAMATSMTVLHQTGGAYQEDVDGMCVGLDLSVAN